MSIVLRFLSYLLTRRRFALAARLNGDSRCASHVNLLDLLLF